MTPCREPALRNNILMMFARVLAAAHMLVRSCCSSSSLFTA